MKTREAILSAFIKDFKLEIPDQGVCFKADIEFATASLFKKFNCEVHIITMAQKNLNVVYLLQQELAEYGLPDTFFFDPDTFFYNEHKCLVIKDYDLLRGKYQLSITPIQGICKTTASDASTQLEPATGPSKNPAA